jgi:hypothetical protein
LLAERRANKEELAKMVKAMGTSGHFVPMIDPYEEGRKRRG